ncbi:MAG: hypothetical protein H7Z14_16720 [Anaerolineae bacterium]|nr:hypothetical protein [Phycisphaerae bacterium]
MSRSPVASQLDSIQESHCASDYLTVPAIIYPAPMRPPAIPPAPTSGLAPQQVTELIAARDRAAKIRRAGGVAKFDAWMIAIFAALTGVTGLFSIPSLLLAAGMGFVAWREFRGVEALRRLDRSAPKSLAINQLCLAAILIAYALWQVIQTATSSGEYTAMAGGDPQLTQMLGPIDDLVKTLTLSVYGLIILIAIFVQGGTALYYFTRQRYLREYLEQTPSWVVDLQRSGISI